MVKAAKIIFSLVFLVLVFGITMTREQTSKPARGLHYAFNGTRDFFEDAYRNVSAQPSSEKIVGITVNHHLLAPNLIAREFALVATDRPVTVVLISPNHFYRGEGGVITSEFDWHTPYGILETDRVLVDKLKQADLVNIDETPFEQEHGISGIVGFIKKSIPNAKFIPIIVKENLADDKADDLAQKLKDILPDGALVVGSLDFSHYLPSNGAQFHDVQTLAVIHNFEFERIKSLDVDSHPGLRVLLKYFDLKAAKKFVLTSHENSSTVTGNYNFVETTSYINGYFTAGANEYDNTRTVLYLQGLGAQDHWQSDASDRLVKFNDQVVTQKPYELGALKLGSGPMAVGLVYNQKLTDIYLFPLTVSNHEITLQPQPEPDTMHIQIK